MPDEMICGPLGFYRNGDPPSTAISIDLDKLVGSHACIVANAGAGKSGAIRRLLEVTHGQIQQIVLDAEDEYYTLRQIGSYLILGGGGDAPITIDGAYDLAQTLLRCGVSAVLQLNDFHAEDQERFIARFLEGMMEAPRDLWHPVLVVLDEAHRFAPQDGSTLCSAQVRDLTARGRKRGFTAVLATQRMAKIDKNVTGDVNNWLLGRVGQTTDRRVAAEALGFGSASAEARGLQKLTNRNFWAMGPAFVDGHDAALGPVMFEVAKTASAMVTAGAAAVPTPPAPKELKAILQGLAQAAKDAAASASKADAPAAAGGMSLADLEDIKTEARNRGIAVGMAMGKSLVADRIREFLDTVEAEDTVEPIEPGEVAISEPSDELDKQLVAAAPAWAREPMRRTARKAAASPGAPAALPAAGRRGTGLRLIDAIAKVYPYRPTWTQACTMVGIKPRGGNFNTVRKMVTGNQWINERADGGLYLSTEAVAMASTSPEVPIGKAMLDAVPGTARRIMEAAIAGHDGKGAITIARLGELTGLATKGGNWNTAMAILRENDMLTREPDGMVRIASFF